MRPDRVGIPEMQYITGLYEMQDQIRKRHPGMLMEGCCGGGRRVDLESLSRFHWHQKSDSWFHTITDQAGMYGGNLYHARRGVESAHRRRPTTTASGPASAGNCAWPGTRWIRISPWNWPSGR